jgi:UDP-N-acetylmuramoyl-L-alanyl-D-glutamate--2,6-diaminopimelate ligase
MDEYFHAKAKLFHALPITGTAIINHDDALGLAMAKESQAPVVSISKNGAADIHFSELSSDLNGIRGKIIAGEIVVSISSSLIGDFNVENILCAVSIAVSLGIDPIVIRDGLSQCTAIPGRMEVFQLPNGESVIVDYAHTPDAYEKVLQTISTMKKPNANILVLFGCGGDRDATKRPEMGRISEKYADQLFITPDNPRSENLDDINNEIVSGLSEDKHQLFYDRSIALKEAMASLNQNDTLVVLGKGRENYQEIEGVKHPYSDIEIIEEFIHAN